MANFAAAYNAMVIRTCEKGRKDTKPRTVVDCSIGVAEMADVYAKFVAFADGTKKDIHSLTCPTEKCPRAIGWSTRPCADWLVKVSGLVYELVSIFPNCKLSMVKNQRAFQSLLKDKLIINSIKDKKKDIDFVDSCDTLVRVVLSMYRSIKNTDEQYQRVKRKLAKDDMMKIDLVLAKMNPATSHEKGDPAEQSPEPVYLQPFASPMSHSKDAAMPLTIPLSWSCKSDDSTKKGEDVYGSPTGSLSSTLLLPPKRKQSHMGQTSAVVIPDNVIDLSGDGGTDDDDANDDALLLKAAAAHKPDEVNKPTTPTTTTTSKKAAEKPKADKDSVPSKSTLKVLYIW